MYVETVTKSSHIIKLMTLYFTVDFNWFTSRGTRMIDVRSSSIVVSTIEAHLQAADDPREKSNLPTGSYDRN